MSDRTRCRQPIRACQGSSPGSISAGKLALCSELDSLCPRLPVPRHLHHPLLVYWDSCWTHKKTLYMLKTTLLIIIGHGLTSPWKSSPHIQLKDVLCYKPIPINHIITFSLQIIQVTIVISSLSDWLVCCLLAGLDLWKKMLLKCSITMVFTCHLQANGQLVVHPPSRIVSCPDLYLLICPLGRQLALRRGGILIPGLIRSPPTLAVHDVAH